mmetsp:Transcript_56447/g.175346  ORF Transcript_56447/g.175346 Transcript_56447/m.175346 type:complete len:184 (-) Transcript_56447:94-645(-)
MGQLGLGARAGAQAREAGSRLAQLHAAQPQLLMRPQPMSMLPPQGHASAMQAQLMRLHAAQVQAQMQAGRHQQQLLAHELALAQQLSMQAESQGPAPRPADGGLVRALPTHTVTASEALAAPEEHQACTICLERFREGDEQRTLPCFHRFHKECVDRWLLQSDACPVCKHRVAGDGCETVLAT